MYDSPVCWWLFNPRTQRKDKKADCLLKHPRTLHYVSAASFQTTDARATLSWQGERVHVGALCGGMKILVHVQTKVSTATTYTISPLYWDSGRKLFHYPLFSCTHTHVCTCTTLTLSSARASQPLIEDHFVQMVHLCVKGWYGVGINLLAVRLRRDSQRWPKKKMARFISNVHTIVHLLLRFQPWYCCYFFTVNWRRADHCLL